MSSRPLPLSLLLGLLGALVLAFPALAKEGAEARLDTALPRDAEPGSTIEVGWSTFAIVEGVERPVYGSPVYIRLVSPDGRSTTEMPGTETPPGSGHYTASIVVPDGGIGEVLVGMRGTACPAEGECYRSDFTFPLTDDPLVTGSTPVGGGTAPSSGVGGTLLTLMALGVAVAVAGGVTAMVVGRRRMIGADATGR